LCDYTPLMATSEPRALRADAERNRRRILDAARQVFAERGLDVGVDLIAQTAGVGVGTLYRRFPTKSDLLSAVIEDGVSRLADEVEELCGIQDPWEAMSQTLAAFAGAIARDRGFYQVIHGTPETVTMAVDSKQRLMTSIGRLLRRAQDAGAVRDDVVADDLGALCMVAARLPHWRLEAQPELWRRYLALALDGLRPDGAHDLPHDPPVPLSAHKPPRRRRAASS
jgi:AcrR family transcriptional regulator